MTISMDLINGINVGIEYVEEDIGGPAFLIDLFIFRFLVEWQ